MNIIDEETLKLYQGYRKQREEGEIDQEEFEKQVYYVTVMDNFGTGIFEPQPLPEKPMSYYTLQEKRDGGKFDSDKEAEMIKNDQELRNYISNRESTKNDNRSNFLFLLKMWKTFSDLQDSISRGKVETKLMLYNRDSMNLWIKEKDREVLDEWIMMKRSYL